MPPGLRLEQLVLDRGSSVLDQEPAAGSVTVVLLGLA